MSSSVARASKYSYRSSAAGGGSADVSIEYSADLTALSRLEVKIIFSQFRITQSYVLERRKFCDISVKRVKCLYSDFHSKKNEVFVIFCVTAYSNFCDL